MLVFSSPVCLARLYLVYCTVAVDNMASQVWFVYYSPTTNGKMTLISTFNSFTTSAQYMFPLFVCWLGWLVGCVVVVVVVVDFHYYFHLLLPFKVTVTVDTTVFFVPSGYVTT